MLRLILPDTHYLESYLEALREGYYSGIAPVKTEVEIQKIEADPFTHFYELNNQGGMFTPEDGIERPRVPHNFLWLVDCETFVGGISLRYALNDFLEKYAGHVGYGIRPSMRGKGYAKKMLALGLDILRERAVTRALVTADEENIGSWKTIEANGGVMENKVPSIFKEGSIVRRYWIEL